MVYFVYILKSRIDNSYYIGQTHNLSNRIFEHNFEETNYTKKKRPWDLIYKEEYKTRSEAVNRERYFKKLKNRKYLEKIIMGP